MRSSNVTPILCIFAALAPSAARAGARRERGRPAIDVSAESASHEEAEPLDISFTRLSSLRLHTSGNLLACDSGSAEIKVISPAGKLIGRIKPGFAPEAIDVAKNGMIYCGGEGKLAVLDKHGRIISVVKAPGNVTSATGGRKRGGSLQPRVSGIAVSDKDVFVTFGSGWSLRSRAKLFRFDLRFGSPKMLAEGLRGCCQRCDLVFRDGVVYVAENAAHRVVAYDRNGKVLSQWGTRSRTGLEGFGSCCNPMNMSFASNGELFTAESGLGRIKRYTADGKFLGLVGYVGVARFMRAGGLAASCSNIAIDISPDGGTVYVMDYKNNKVLVLAEKN